MRDKTTKKKWYPPKRENGYQYFKDKEGNLINIHRRVAEKKYGKIPEGFIVHHIDGSKTNNRPSNLILLHKKDHVRFHGKTKKLALVPIK